MARLEIRLNGEGKRIELDTTLRTVRIARELLRCIEKEMTGKRATTPWQVDISSGIESTIVGIHADSSRGEDGSAALNIVEVMREAAKALTRYHNLSTGIYYGEDEF